MAHPKEFSVYPDSAGNTCIKVQVHDAAAVNLYAWFYCSVLISAQIFRSNLSILGLSAICHCLRKICFLDSCVEVTMLITCKYLSSTLLHAFHFCHCPCSACQPLIQLVCMPLGQ